MMPLPFRRAQATALLAAGLAFAPACGRDEPPPRRDSVVAVPAPPVDSAAPPAPPAPPSAWALAGAGPALLVHGDTTQAALAAAVLPEASDSTSDSTLVAGAAALNGITVDLFAPTGKVGSTTLTVRAADNVPSEECTTWPVVRLAGAPTTKAWTVAFGAGRAVPITVDSLQGLAGADSAARTAEVARLASLVPGTNAGEFAGLPFSVRQARRFVDPAGADVIVAEAVRKIAQEADPREQHILLVGERAPRARQYTLAYHETSAGGEVEVETRELLAAVRLGDARRPTLVLNREDGEGIAYFLLERVGERRWRRGWTSAKKGCEAVVEP